LIAGIGQALDAKGLFDGFDVKLNKNGFIEADRATCQTSVNWIFAGGDAVLGPASVVDAIAAGEKAAVGIDKLLTGAVPTDARTGEHAFWRQAQPLDTLFDPDADPVQYPRSKMQLLPVKKRKNNFQEVEQPWPESVARREAKRCLRCDYKPECANGDCNSNGHAGNGVAKAEEVARASRP
jgi:NADH-quinone oxidoreductase subunit F